VRSATLDDVSDFFRTYYHPGNASIVVAGDVDTADALDLVSRYFGEIDRGPAIPPVTAPGGEPAAQNLLLTDRVHLPRLYLGWRSPGLFQPGDAELDLVASVLARGKTSRLYRSLVFERRIATDVSAAQNSRELSGFFQIAVTAASGVALGEVERVVMDEVNRISTDGCLPGELERSRAEIEAQFVEGLQSVGGFGGRSDQLNAYNVFVGDPGFIGRDLHRYRTADPEGMRSAAGRWLVPDGRIALSVVPHGAETLALPDSAFVSVS
jgi:zinc protease